MDLTNITGGNVTYGRKLSPAQYESASAEISVGLREGADIERTLGALEELVERRLIGQAQRRVERERFYQALMKVNVPAEDAEAALQVMGRAMPADTTGFRVETAMLKRLYAGGKDGLPITWQWWSDGKHAHPNAPATDEFSEVA